MWMVHALWNPLDSVYRNVFDQLNNSFCTVARELCKLAQVTGPELPPLPFCPVGHCLPATGGARWYKRQCLPGLCTMCWKVLVNPTPSPTPPPSLHAEKCAALPLDIRDLCCKVQACIITLEDLCCKMQALVKFMFVCLLVLQNAGIS